MRISAVLNTRLPVTVSLLELSDPFTSARQRDTAPLNNSYSDIHLTRQPDGRFSATIQLGERQPATRYFQVAARYTLLWPFSRTNGKDLRVGVTQRPLTLPPDPGAGGATTVEGIDSDDDGLRDDLQREIFFDYPGSERARRALADAFKVEQDRLVYAGDATRLKTLGYADYKLMLWCLEELGIAHTPDTQMRLAALESTLLNTPLRLRRGALANNNTAAVTPESDDARQSTCLFDPASLLD